MLYMRTVAAATGPRSEDGVGPAEREPTDLTARARIRDAAIQSFADEGFGASVRTIAAAAQVSPALITHHFGTKQALREDCDAEVLRRYRELKTDALAHPSAHLLGNLNPLGTSGSLGANGSLLVYMLRSIQVGGQAGRDFVEHLMDDARGYMAAGVASGVIKPSRDEEARLRYLTYQSLGALMIAFMLGSADGVESAVREIRTQTILPTLELFTEGLLADSSMLDDYVAYLNSGK